MKMTTWKCGCMAAALAATSVMPPCVFAGSTVTASREYVDRQFEAALGYVDSALENQWLMTTNAIEEAIAGVHGPTNDVPQAATSLPEMAGTPRAGTSNEYARADHVHPSDTNKLDKIGGTAQDLHIQTSDNQAWRLTNGGLVNETKYPNAGWHSIYEIAIPSPRDSSSTLALAAETGTFTPGNLAALDSQGNPVDSGLTTNYVTKIADALADKATKADATLTERFSAWTLSGDVEAGSQYEVRFDYDNEGTTLWGLYKDGDLFSTGSDNPLSTIEDFPFGLPPEEYTITATRTAPPGYVLGSQTDKPLASEAEAEALRQGKADRAANPTAGNLAALDSNGNLTNSQIPKASVVTIPTYNGQNHDFLSATSLVPGEDFASTGIHRWTMPRKGIVYVRLISTSSSSTVRIGVNVEAGAVDVDDAHCITALSQFKNNANMVVPLFLNAGDEVCLSVSTNPLQYVLFSCFYTD